MDASEIRKIREFWCKVFGMPESIIDTLDTCITLGESTEGMELIPGQKPITGKAPKLKAKVSKPKKKKKKK